MSLRTCSTVLVLLATVLAVPASAQERAPAPRKERHEGLDRERRQRIGELRERIELRREIRRHLREHRPDLHERLAERLRHRHERYQRDGAGERWERRRWSGREGRHEGLRERLRSRRPA